MTLRTRRRDRRMEGGRLRKKEEALFAQLRPVAVRGVTVVAAVRGCVTEPLSLENNAASYSRVIGNPSPELRVAAVIHGPVPAMILRRSQSLRIRGCIFQ
ncbi:hypothetical protein AHAS_Ahas20G0171500 [Arachis hypogaea]